MSEANTEIHIGQEVYLMPQWLRDELNYTGPSVPSATQSYVGIVRECVLQPSSRRRTGAVTILFSRDADWSNLRDVSLPLGRAEWLIRRGCQWVVADLQAMRKRFGGQLSKPRQRQLDNAERILNGQRGLYSTSVGDVEPVQLAMTIDSDHIGDTTDNPNKGDNFHYLLTTHMFPESPYRIGGIFPERRIVQESTCPNKDGQLAAIISVSADGVARTINSAISLNFKLTTISDALKIINDSEHNIAGVL